MPLSYFQDGMVKKLTKIIKERVTRIWCSFFTLPAMMLAVTFVLSLVSLLYIYVSPYTLSAKEISIHKGANTWTTLSNLHDEGILPHPLIVLMGSLTIYGSSKIQAGEYLFNPGLSPKDIMKMLREGKVIEHIITFPEGITVHEILIQINKDDRFSDEDIPTAQEGSLFPSTYKIHRNQSKKLLIKTMSDKMDITAIEVMKSNKNPFIKNPHDLIIFASILEREAANPEELPRIAGVFVNRLKRKMRLQSCPTAIYAKTQGRQKFSFPLTYTDLAINSGYNTYQRTGLPIGPICCPGLRALEAAANPSDTNELFFVFDGKRHHFSVTYQEHLKRKRQIQNAIKDYQ